MQTNSRIADILERLTLAPAKPVLDFTNEKVDTEPNEIGPDTILFSPLVNSGENGEKAIDRAVRLLIENPSWKKRTLMDLKRETGIDHNTWAKAKRRAK